MSAVSIDQPAQGLFRARLQGYAGPALFAAWQSAARGHGWRWNRERGEGSANLTTSAAQVAPFIADLGRAGFNIAIAPDVLALLEKQAAGYGARAAIEHAATAVPDGLRLYPYQRDGVVFLRNRAPKGALLADDMGLGKTVQALIALDQGQPALVVSPAVVTGKWSREVRRWTPWARVAVVLRGATKRVIARLAEQRIDVLPEARWPVEGEIVVVNYESCPGTSPRGRLAGMDGQVAPKTVLVLDEAHRAKNPKAAVTVRIRELRDAVQGAGGWVWCLTGTPLFNRPPDLWHVMEDARLGEEAFGHFGAFYRLMGGEQTRWGTDWTGRIDPAVPGLLKPVMLRRMREDVLDLPEWTYEEIPVQPAEALAKYLDDLQKRLATEGCDLDAALASAKAAPDVAAALEAVFKTMRSKVGFEAYSALLKALSEAALPAATDIIEDYEEAGKPLVVFSAHRAPAEALGARSGWGLLIGGMDKSSRDEVVTAFQGGRLKGVAATIDAAKEGIDLYKADTVLFLSQTWNPSDNDQAASRIRRIGQTASRCLQIHIQIDHRLVSQMGALLAEKVRVNAEAVNRASRVTYMEEIQHEAEAALEIARNGKQTTPERPITAIPAEVLEGVADGYYATAGANGKVAFWQVEKPDRDPKWAGWAFVRTVLGGPHGLRRARWAAIRPDRTTTVAGALTVLSEIAKDPIEAMRRFGRELGCCGRCGRALTNERSRRLQMGPVCAAILGIDVDAADLAAGE